MIQLKNKKVAVLGVLDPGIAAIRFAGKQGARVTGYGVATENEEKRITQVLKGVSFDLVTENIPNDGLNNFEVIIVTPGGGRRYQKQMESARKKGIPVVTDLELACAFYKTPIIAVTGTNGKSTVVHLIKSFIEESGKTALVAGGDYAEFCDSILNPPPYQFALLEVNSSRLMRVTSFHPHIAVFLNLYPGHSERHKDFKEYAETKGKIFAEQGENDFLVFSVGTVSKLVQEKKPKAKLYPFVIGRKLTQGAYLDAADHQIIFADENNFSSFSLANFHLAGAQNIENAMAAICVGKICGIEDHVIQKVLEKIEPLPDRMELVQKLNGIRYFNDAKAVNPIATFSVLVGFEGKSVVLIAGGEFSPHVENKYLIEMIQKKVRILILFGTDRRQFHKVLGGSAESYVVPTLKDGVELAYKMGQKGDTIIFSPASRPELHVHGSTQKRGLEFRRLVGELAEMNRARKVLMPKV